MFKLKRVMYLTLASLLVSLMSFAESPAKNNGEIRSIGGLKQRMPTGEKNKIILIEQIKLVSEKIASKGMDRVDIKAVHRQKEKQVLATTLSNDGLEYSRMSHYSFSIYTGYSQLISDIDEDGYYQTFSVTFDADILSPIANEQALVYAELYLSQNGGPWILYFSTDNFLITGEDTEDEFEVVTQLDSGYLAEHYDVLIDLYEVGYSDVVATYSANDNNMLYALPLESADYDPEYIEVEYYAEHGGSSNWLLIVSLLLLLYRRS